MLGALDQENLGPIGPIWVEDQGDCGLASLQLRIGHNLWLVGPEGGLNLLRTAHGGILAAGRVSCLAVILISNDDGPESPALQPLVRALAKLGDLRVVVPDGERSWIGKAISRFEAISTRRVVEDGIETVLVSGTPADSVNLAVHSLFTEPPELVVCGVNIGLNVGAAFFLSSGTVGAAMEAGLGGIPAIAFSVGQPDADRDWKARCRDDEFEPVWERAAALAADVVARVREAGLPRGADLLNVNFPLQADIATPRVVTRVAPVSYAGLFSESQPGVYNHGYGGGIKASAAALAGSDVEAVRAGRVSISPVRIFGEVEPDSAFARAICDAPD